jgi:hypothetical protein
VAGAPAFQASPHFVQANAFQSGVSLVGADFSLGSPAFAAPSLGINYQFSAPAYSLSSPVFATPTMASGANFVTLPVNPYSLGALGFTTPFLRSTQRFNAPNYSLSLSWGTATFAQNHRFFTNRYDLQLLSWGTAQLRRQFQLTAPAYSLGGLDFSAALPFQVNHALQVNDYWLESPRFAYPRFVAEFKVQPWPMTYLAAVEDAAAMLRKLLDLLLSSIPAAPLSPERTKVRRLIAILRGNADAAIRSDTLGTQLAEIYMAADVAGAQYGGVEEARRFLMAQVANKSIFSQIVFRSALIMNLGLQSKVIGRINFRTQTQVQNMILHMRDAFDKARAIGIDEVDVLVYQAITAMSGALINHLAVTQLKLPRHVTYTVGMPMPSLYLAQRIHIDATRADEIERDNGVIHPAFVPRKIRVLSNADEWAPLGEPLQAPGKFSGSYASNK